MNKQHYNLIVIGAGPAGTPAAMEYATLQPAKKVLLIDKKGKLGGECLFDGCIPSKILEATGERLTPFNQLQSFGAQTDAGKPSLDWNAVVQKKNTILNGRSDAAQDKLNTFKNITLQKGEATFTGTKTIEIYNEGMTDAVSFDKAIIATGSRTFIPPFDGDGVSEVWDNKIFFDTMELPKNITIIGNGPSGIEFCQILAGLGVTVTLIGNAEHILPMIDPEFSEVLRKKLEETENINLVLRADVKEINKTTDGFNISYTQAGEDKAVKSERVLIATGRTPNIETLNLNKAGIKSERKGVVVNTSLQTSNPDIYAGGDVALGVPQFAHTASYMAHIIVQNLFFGRNKVRTNFDKNAWVLFSEPNIVSAGISEVQAKKKGIETITGKYDYMIDAKSQIENAASGYLKYVVDKRTLQILGIQIITKDAHTISGEAAVIISNKLTLLDLVDTIHPHPTLSESFSFLAKAMMSKVMQERMKNPLFKVGFFFKKWL